MNIIIRIFHFFIIVFVFSLHFLHLNAVQDYDCADKDVCITGFDESKARFENNSIIYSYSGKEKLKLTCHVAKHKLLSSCLYDDSEVVNTRWMKGQASVSNEITGDILTIDIDLPLDDNVTDFKCESFAALYPCKSTAYITFLYVPEVRRLTETQKENFNVRQNENHTEAHNGTVQETHTERQNNVTDNAQNKFQNLTYNGRQNKTQSVTNNETQNKTHNVTYNETQNTTINETQTEILIEKHSGIQNETQNQKLDEGMSNNWIIIPVAIFITISIVISIYTLLRNKKVNGFQDLIVSKENSEYGNDEDKEESEVKNVPSINAVDPNSVYDYCERLPMPSFTKSPIIIGCINSVNLSNEQLKEDNIYYNTTARCDKTTVYYNT
ncbi:jg14785 [Pararge aegeria aegeria]|uniref:Jg14785 protein n=1 Tax=Pararge aegeria aegeria TaxID=348720 RepID=A0A8S4SN40_9NEOP|nr:jg14785 [Pararge aegeria aegeria]